jgi:eukaryotic-like serine/threonine-protein kinase
MTGQQVGHYRILEKIGSGAMGDVFRARDERLGRDVALKLIRPASSDNPDHLRRFELEARAAAALNHPNVLAIYDVGFDGIVPYIVSELLEGKTLRKRLTEGPIQVQEATDFALQIASGLAAAHKRHIVHRDLKPENLFLTTEGRVKILDFGVAKLQSPPEDKSSIQNQPTVTKSGAVIGTVAYMSPEQLRGKAVDHRCDIFSFGAILYEMLSGRRAFIGETEVDTMTAVLREEPPEAPLADAAIPPAYRDLVRYCLDKEPENRFQSVKDLAFALQTLSGSSPGSEVPLPAPKKKTKGALSWTVAAILAVATVVVLVLYFQPQLPPPAYVRLTSEKGTVYLARFAGDGKSIVYGAAWNGKPVQLFSTVGESLLAQALNLQDANLLALSRTNELAIATHGTHNGQLETVGGTLATAPLAGGSPREMLFDVRWADWDPDGKLAVVHNVDSRSQLEFPVGNVIYQTNGWISNIRFSPQGDTIAFLNHPRLWDDRGTVCTVDLAGHLKTLTPQWEYTDGLAWRPDGKEVWFAAARTGNNANIMAVTLSGKTRNLLDLPEGIALQDIASDGRVLVALNSKRLEMAAGSLGSKEDVDLSWHDWSVAKDISRDGKMLFEDASETAGPNYWVAWRGLDGSLPPVRLGEGSAGGLSPDGNWAISFPRADAEQVVLLPTGTGEPRSINLTGLEKVSHGWARFLPDGREITLNANEHGHADRCFLLDLAGANPRALTPEGTHCGPSSPDGRFVVGVNTSGKILLYPVAGGTPQVIPGLDSGFVPVQWSQDGSTLYAYRQGELPSRIYKIVIATGKRDLLQELRPSTPAGIVNISPIVVSRDGTRFAYSYNQTWSVLYLISGLH